MVDILRLTCAVGLDVGDTHDQVDDENAGCHEGDEPGEDVGGVAGELQEREEGEQDDYQEGLDGHAILGCLAQESRAAPVNR